MRLSQTRYATGISTIFTTETERRIVNESEDIGKVNEPEEFDKNKWTIIRKTETTITLNRPTTVELTCATIVNRIPDIINAKPGFVPTCNMDELFYRTKNLNEYIK